MATEVERLERLVAAIVPMVERARLRNRSLPKDSEHDADWEKLEIPMDASAASTSDRIRAFYVHDVPSGILEVEVITSTGKILPRIELTSGMFFDDAFMRSVKFIPDGTGQASDIAVIYVSAYKLPQVAKRVWEPYELTASLAGNAATQDFDAIAGYEYELLGATVYYTADGNAANRVPIITFYQSDGTTILGESVWDEVTASMIATLVAVPNGGSSTSRAQPAGQSHVFMGQGFAQRVRFKPGQTAVKLADYVTTAGLAGDAVIVTFHYRRRRLLS